MLFIKQRRLKAEGVEKCVFASAILGSRFSPLYNLASDIPAPKRFADPQELDHQPVAVRCAGQASNDVARCVPEINTQILWRFIFYSLQIIFQEPLMNGFPILLFDFICDFKIHLVTFLLLCIFAMRISFNDSC